MKLLEQRLEEQQSHEGHQIDDRRIHTFYMCAIGSLIPFTGLIIALLVVSFKRKIEDFYLRKSYIFLVAGMILRITLCVIVMILYYLNHIEDYFKGNELLALKIQTFMFTIPYYFFVLVTTSLIFSAIDFTKSVRIMLNPSIIEDRIENR